MAHSLTPRESAFLAELNRNPNATYRQLAAAVGCSTGQIRPLWESLADRDLCPPPLPPAQRSALAGFADGWDRAAALLGNPQA